MSKCICIFRSLVNKEGLKKPQFCCWFSLWPVRELRTRWFNSFMDQCYVGYNEDYETYLLSRIVLFAHLPLLVGYNTFGQWCLVQMSYSWDWTGGTWLCIWRWMLQNIGKKAQILHGLWQKEEEGRRFLQMYMNSEDSKFLIRNSV